MAAQAVWIGIGAAVFGMLALVLLALMVYLVYTARVRRYQSVLEKQRHEPVSRAHQNSASPPSMPSLREEEEEPLMEKKAVPAVAGSSFDSERQPLIDAGSRKPTYTPASADDDNTGGRKDASLRKSASLDLEPVLSRQVSVREQIEMFQRQTLTKSASLPPVEPEAEIRPAEPVAAPVAAAASDQVSKRSSLRSVREDQETSIALPPLSSSKTATIKQQQQQQQQQQQDQVGQSALFVCVCVCVFSRTIHSE
jgi:hypothetical protein